MRRWRTRLLVFTVLLAVRVLHVAACAPPSRADAEARLAYLVRRLDAGDGSGLCPGHPFDGEWRLGTHSMTVLAATNLAFRHPETRAARAAEVDRLVLRLRAKEARAFDGLEWGRDALDELDGPRGHAGYLGHLAVALGAQCLVGGAVDGPFHRAVVDALARRVDASPTGLVETYPGETYVPDNVVAVAGVALFDTCAGAPVHAATLARWRGLLRERWTDAATGALVFAPGQPARGSGAAWSALFLRFVDEGLAAEEDAALRRHFEVALPLGLRALRERPVGDDAPGDVDSGPLVFGLSPSATGFALAPAVLSGDEARHLGLRRTAEVVGLTVGVSERRYLFAPLVGDAIVLAATTATRWDRRFLSGREATAGAEALASPPEHSRAARYAPPSAR